jgi:hypothetical protein
LDDRPFISHETRNEWGTASFLEIRASVLKRIEARSAFGDDFARQDWRSGKDGQDEGGGVCGVVVDGLGGFDEFGAVGGGFGGVEVAVEAGEVGRRDFETDFVSF